jgi:hypothetical protein
LDEPVPDRLLTMLKTESDSVVDMAKARAKKAEVSTATQKSNFNWLAMAASLVMGVLIGALAMNLREEVQGAGDLVASNTISKALSTQLASASDSTVQVGLSYRSKSGEYCRSFVTNGNAGLACRQDNAWQVKMLVPAEKSNDGTYRTAASAMPKSILEKVEHDIQGDALDAEGEALAIKQGWKKASE